MERVFIACNQLSFYYCYLLSVCFLILFMRQFHIIGLCARVYEKSFE